MGFLNSEHKGLKITHGHGYFEPLFYKIRVKNKIKRSFKTVFCFQILFATSLLISLVLNSKTPDSSRYFKLSLFELVAAPSDFLLSLKDEKVFKIYWSVYYIECLEQEMVTSAGVLSDPVQYVQVLIWAGHRPADVLRIPNFPIFSPTDQVPSPELCTHWSPIQKNRKSWNKQTDASGWLVGLWYIMEYASGKHWMGKFCTIDENFWKIEKLKYFLENGKIA